MAPTNQPEQGEVRLEDLRPVGCKGKAWNGLGRPRPLEVSEKVTSAQGEGLPEGLWPPVVLSLSRTRKGEGEGRAPEIRFPEASRPPKNLPLGQEGGPPHWHPFGCLLPSFGRYST